MQTLTSAQASPEVPINENFESARPAEALGIRQPATAGLTFGYYGGKLNGVIIADGTLTLTASTTNYVVVHRITGAVTVSTATTNWADTTTYLRTYSIVVGTASITSYIDYRQGYGVTDQGPPITIDSTARAIVLADAGTLLLHPSTDTSARTWTIPANASVAFPVGAVLRFVNHNAAGVLTIAITSDTLRLAGAGTVGSRTLAANGIAKAVKLSATEWLIYGTGLT